MATTPYLRSKRSMLSRCVLWLTIILILLCLFGCSPKQEPNQTVINYTDNSQIVQVVGDNNQMAATSDVQAGQQSATPTQTTENTSKSDAIFWVMFVLISACIAVGVYWYQKKRIL